MYSYLERKLGKGFFLNQIYNRKLINDHEKAKLEILCNKANTNMNGDYNKEYVLATHIMYKIVKNAEI